MFFHHLQVLPKFLSKPELPKLVCEMCKSINDLDYNFCKSCGSDRREQNVKEKLEKKDIISLEHIEERIKTLDQRLDTSRYSQQKCNLKKELEQFLVSLNPAKDVYTALPNDLRSF